MNPINPAVKRRSAQAQGAKTLITVAAVAITLAGWAALSTAATPMAAHTPATVGVVTLPTPLPFGRSPSGQRTRRGGVPAAGAPSTGQSPAPSARTRSSR